MFLIFCSYFMSPFPSVLHRGQLGATFQPIILLSAVSSLWAHLCSECFEISFVYVTFCAFFYFYKVLNIYLGMNSRTKLPGAKFRLCHLQTVSQFPHLQNEGDNNPDVIGIVTFVCCHYILDPIITVASILSGLILSSYSTDSCL